MKNEGWYVVAADWVANEFMANDEFCNEFMLLDLRILENCVKATEGCEYVFHLAADMGGMGFIQSNQAVLQYNNIMLSCNMLEAARRTHVRKFFFSSSACVYNERLQEDTANPGLREQDAWPAWPQDAYGLEKLFTEEICKHYSHDFGLITRVARFHNVYGPFGTWKGGREKAPAAFCRKAIVSSTDFEMWGDGLQTRSFIYVDDCVEGVLRLMESDCAEPINMGTEEMISMNDFAALAMSFEGKNLPIRHIPGPQGVRGRNSNNEMIRARLGWEPLTSVAVGLRTTYFWIKSEIEKEASERKNVTEYSVSHVVQQTTESLDILQSTHNA